MRDMSQREVTSEEIDQLFDFVRRKRVRYYDLQVELVDHLASGIEAIWAKEPQCSFTQARDRIYASFGITGFAHVVDERIQAIHRQVWREAKAYLWSTLSYPRIILTLSSCTLLTNLFLIGLSPYLITGGSVLILLAIMLAYYVKKPRYEQKKVRFIRTEGVRSALGMMFGLSQLLIFQVPELLTYLPGMGIFLAGTLGIALYYTYVLVYALTVHADQRAREDLARQFPHLVQWAN